MPWLYPVIMGTAIAVGLLISRRTQSSLHLTKAQRTGIALGAFLGAMLGAKLPYALVDWHELLSGRAWFAEGKTILTGLAGGYLGVVVAKWSLDIKTRTGDSFAVPVAASIAVGRLGCFVAGCCYGCPTTLPWGVVFAGHGTVPRHPAQLYEAAFHAMAAFVLYAAQRDGLFRGNLFKAYIVAYCIYRFFSEFIRDEPRLWLGLTVYQWAAMVVALIFAWLWWCDRQAPRTSSD